MGETAQAKGEQDGKEAENGRMELEDKRLPREEEGSILQARETHKKEARRRRAGEIGRASTEVGI